MTPVTIGGIYGVLHPAAGNHGVVICGSLGDEALNIHRAQVFLAEQFASAGFPALRLNYYGTGDSAGEDDEPDRFDAWIDSIIQAVRWLRAECGILTVSLCGIRIGGMLAALAASKLDDVASLLMLAPISGRRFVRELILHAQSEKDIWQANSQIDDGQWFEAFGLRIQQPTRRALERLDLGELNVPDRIRVLAIDRTDSPSRRAVWDDLRARGLAVTHETAGDLQDMLQDAHASKVPHATFARAVSWLGEADRKSCSPGPISAPAALDLDFAREWTVRFGANGVLIGILCVPTQGLEQTPIILIPNTGASPRSGNSRCTVTLARWLAWHGVPSLRMDGSGIGDAAPETGERGQPYTKQADRDLLAGLDFLAKRFDNPVLVLGICSGAYHALQAAVADPRIRGLVLINLQKFLWQEGESLTVIERTTFRTTRFYLRNMLSQTVWRRLLWGDINIQGILAALAGRTVRHAAAMIDPVIARLRGETRVGTVRRQLAELEARRMPILYLLSGNDPGLDEIAEYFGIGGARLRGHANVTFEVLDGADHTLSARWARNRLQEILARFLLSNFSLQRFAIAVADLIETKAETENSGGSEGERKRVTLLLAPSRVIPEHF